MKEKILQKLDKVVDAVALMDLNDLLGLTTPEELKELQDTLLEMEQDFLIYKTKKDKYILIKNMSNMKVGRLSVNRRGTGFLIIPNADDIKIDRDNLKGAVHDDMVLCEIFSERNKDEGRVLKVLKRELNNLVGELVLKDNRLVLDLDDEKRDFRIDLDQDSLHGCVEGSKVLVEITKEVSRKRYKGRIKTIIGHKTDPGVDILSIAYKYGIIDEWNDEETASLSSVPEVVSENELQGRTDLTGKMIFTIDGADTKDIDDAISLEMDGDNFILGVHIADVSHYVTEGSPIDDEAYKRATSSYLADTVIPMLPRQLSNNICSLNEGVIRLALSCEMKIDSTGKIIDSNIFESYIKSRKKMTYTNVNEIIMHGRTPEGYEEFAETLLNMNKLAKILRRYRIEKGYLDFNLDEAKIVQDEQGRAIDVVKRTRGDGEELIEDFMIAANETVAERLTYMELPCVYRVHDLPNDEKIEKFLNLTKILGYNTQIEHNDFSNRGIQKILSALSDKKEATILSSLLLRSMKKAVYQTNNIGHFGLGSKMYCHFTSPIRRYPDLMVHRLLRKFLFNGEINNEAIEEVMTTLEEKCIHCSEKEQAAEKCERDVFDMKSAEYMEQFIGQKFHGVINTITNFGFYVELPNLVEGLVHINTLKGDYYVYVEELLSLIGQNTKKTYRLGDEVDVTLVGASKEAATIDFEIVGDKDGNSKQESTL